ncbi:hypothetical protein HMPREF0972_00834 [Actinomyces sp. oral taxon 848 str. F0332]|nr:hypothetical protein HMPREF0972_00834 [Actinomyces sp. oral taxon 848 str. F0332]
MAAATIIFEQTPSITMRLSKLNTGPKFFLTSLKNTEEKSGVATLTLTQRFSTTVFWRLPLQSLANALETETTLAPMNSLCYLTTLLR